jgi:hypothetical protein
MPFTLSHPAIVLPLHKWFKNHVSLTGLFVGSMVPDVEYCINTVTRSVVSHTVKGIWTFDIPVGILLSLCYHGFVKQIICFQMPSWIGKRLMPYAHLNWFGYLRKNSFIFLTSLTIGIILHLLWDSVSHSTGYWSARSTFLQQQIFDSFTVTRLIWHISTYAGIYVMYNYFKNLPTADSTNTTNKGNKHFWPLVFLVACMIMVFHWLPFVRPQEPRFIFVAFSGAMLAGILVVCFIFSLKKKWLQ